jgi:hypothetical protein
LERQLLQESDVAAPNGEMSGGKNEIGFDFVSRNGMTRRQDA